MGKKKAKKQTKREIKQQSRPQPPYDGMSGLRGVAYFAVMIAAILLLVVLAQDKTDTSSKPGIQTGYGSSYMDVAKQYYDRHAQLKDQSWLSDQEDLLESGLAMQKYAEHLRTLLARYQDTTPLAQRIYSEFKNFRVTTFTSNGVSHELISGQDPAELLNTRNVLEICMIPPALASHPTLINNNLYYRKEWGAVMMKSVAYPDAWLAALVYHEMGHALRHRVDKAESAIAPPGTDSYIFEEIEMHELEHQLLAAAVEEFTPLLDSIITRQGEASFDRLAEIYVGLADKDLLAFDSMFNLQQAGPHVVNTTTAQFLLSIGLRCIETDSSLNAAQKKQSQIELYRNLAR